MGEEDVVAVEDMVGVDMVEDMAGVVIGEGTVEDDGETNIMETGEIMEEHFILGTVTIHITPMDCILIPTQ